jgi:hypothetical protein
MARTREPGDRERALQRLLREIRSRRCEFAANQRLSDDIVELLREIFPDAAATASQPRRRYRPSRRRCRDS